MPRDEFSLKTIDILAKRVGYLCSNPQCRKPTVGPHEYPLKAIINGIAAHITAAACGGPRFDAGLSEFDRSSIENGIWLCSNCATLIDKTPVSFSVELLQSWKQAAEAESWHKIAAAAIILQAKTPFLEADLIWNSGGRFHMGYSGNNPTELIEGRETVVIRHDRPPLVFWRLTWNFKITIYNNSEVPAYNVKVTPLTDVVFSNLSKLPNINNLPAFQNLDLSANYETMLEGTYLEADEIRKKKIPLNLEGLQLRIAYQDEQRRDHTTLFFIQKGELINQKEK